MKGGTTKSLGFTIVETLIVLTVTSAMFVAATVYISGRQNKVLFNDAIQDIRGRIQENINQVSAGQYTSKFGCEVSGTAINITSTPNTKGDCIYVGKAMLFGVPSGATAEAYRIETIVGKRVSGGKVTDTLSNASATLLTPSSSTSASSLWPDGSELINAKNGLSIVSVKAEGVDLMGFAIVASGYGDVSYAGDVLESGSLQPSLVPIKKDPPPSGTRADRAKFVNNLFASPTGPGYNPVGGIQLCFKSGTTNQSGLITLGVNNRTLNTELAIKNGPSC